MGKDESIVELLDAVCAVDDSSGIGADIYVIEECAELVKELTKDRRGKGDREKIVEEACDVLATIGIMLRKYGVPEEDVEEKVRFKCRRAIERWESRREV